MNAKIEICIAVLAALAALPPSVHGREQEANAIQRKLESEYKASSVLDDKSDFAKKGSTLVLHKGKVFMIDATAGGRFGMNTYRDGTIGTTTACAVGGLITHNPLRAYVHQLDKAP